MAFDLVAEAVGLPLLDRLRRHRSRLTPHVERAAKWLRDVTEPPIGLEVRSEDGSTYTGVLVVERNRPVVVLAVRHPGALVPLRAPVVPPPPVERPAYGRGYLDPDAPYWDRDSVPYGR